VPNRQTDIQTHRHTDTQTHKPPNGDSDAIARIENCMQLPAVYIIQYNVYYNMILRKSPNTAMSTVQFRPSRPACIHSRLIINSSNSDKIYITLVFSLGRQSEAKIRHFEDSLHSSPSEVLFCVISQCCIFSQPMDRLYGRILVCDCGVRPK